MSLQLGNILESSSESGSDSESRLDSFVTSGSDSESDSFASIPRKRKRSWSTPQMLSVKREMKRRNITINEVAGLDIPVGEKTDLMEQFMALQGTTPNTTEYFSLRNNLRDKIDNFKSLSTDERKQYFQLQKVYSDTQTYQKRILHLNADLATKQTIFQKYQSILKGKISDTEKEFQWIEDVLKLPYNNSTNWQRLSNQDVLKSLKTNLDKQLYGLNNVKERIMEIVSGILINKNIKNRMIALCGPPGVGKTMLGRCIAGAFDIPFQQISMGGISDSSYIKGHSFTYVGSRPGIIVRSLQRMEVNDGILFLDEIDKIQDTLQGKEVSASLMHLLDYTQNSDFRDIYMPEIPINISNIFFILSLNDEKKLDKILRDRLHIIRIDGYTLEDKLNIAKNHIIPNTKKELLLHERNIQLSDKVITHIIDKTEREPGVRNLERNIRLLFQKINTVLTTQKCGIQMSYAFKINKTLKIDANLVDRLLE